jgi:hypothetical protein
MKPCQQTTLTINFLMKTLTETEIKNILLMKVGNLLIAIIIIHAIKKNQYSKKNFKK